MKIDLTCRTCDYDLTALDMSACCPECGCAVASTFSTRSFLAVPAEEIARIRRGLMMTYWATLGAIIAIILFGIVLSLIVAGEVADGPVIDVLLFLVFAVALPVAWLAITTIGLFRATRKTSGESAKDRQFAGRVRAASIRLLAASVCCYAAIIAANTFNMSNSVIESMFALVSIGVLAALTALMWTTLRFAGTVLERAHQWKRARRSGIRMVVYVVVAVLSVLLMAIVPIGRVAFALIMIIMVLSIAGYCATAARAMKLIVAAQPTFADVTFPAFVDPDLKDAEAPGADT